MPSDRIPTTLFLPKEQITVIEAIVAERRRQIEVEGWTPEHDDEHDGGEMARAAAAYADHAARFRDAFVLGSRYALASPHPLWPWDRKWWKPKDPRRDLIRAAALIAAEIERMDRRDGNELVPADGPPPRGPQSTRVTVERKAKRSYRIDRQQEKSDGE